MIAASGRLRRLERPDPMVFPGITRTYVPSVKAPYFVNRLGEKSTARSAVFVSHAG